MIDKTVVMKSVTSLIKGSNPLFASRRISKMDKATI
jgi:hypothetical protein